jgi:ribosome-associated protein
MSESQDAAPGSGLRVRTGLVIPESEIDVRHSRSGGPGGQNVNKVSTRVELVFDLEASTAFDPEQKQQLRSRLASRLSRAGALRVVGQRYRSQARNESDARERLAALLAAALAVPKRRRPTRPSRAAAADRLAGKRRRSRLKTTRRAPDDAD